MVTIRPAESADASAIAAVHRAAFPTPAEAALVEALTANGTARYPFVAVAEDVVVGHVVFSPVTVGGYGAGGLGLAPLAVRPDHQRRGIGARLVRAGLDRCREAGCPFVVVLGDPHFYRRFGFRPAAPLGLLNEYGAGDEFMIFQCENAPALDGGLVRYGAEFAAFAG